MDWALRPIFERGMLESKISNSKSEEYFWMQNKPKSKKKKPNY